jgi:hypothetical protein
MIKRKSGVFSMHVLSLGPILGFQGLFWAISSLVWLAAAVAVAVAVAFYILH